MEKPHRDTVQSTEEAVLGNIPKIKFNYKVNNIVYFTAFPKKNPKCFFACKGIVKEAVEKNGKPVYRVEVVEVGAKPILCPEKADPKHLLGKIVTKREYELSKYLSPLMTPKQWVK